MAIDVELVRLAALQGLPLKSRWMINATPLDFDFGRSQQPLQTLSSSDVNGCDITKEWAALYIFGEDKFAEGGGGSSWFGVHNDTGEVFGLDLERETSPMFFLNSGIGQFVKTFRVFNEALNLGTLALGDLRHSALRADPLSFVNSEWRVLAEHLSST